MHWQDLQREIAAKLPGNAALAAARPIVYVDSARQELLRIDAGASEPRVFRVSTAKQGMGNRKDSYQTPLGIHRIREKIGAGEARGMVFEAREACGRIVREFDNREADEITSRILWLDGMEDGVNRGAGCDTYSRYIYIHGTSDEQRIGQPVSAGCIRMLNDDIIELFDAVRVDDLVLIR